MFFKKNGSSKDKLNTFNVGMYGFWNNLRMSQAAVKNIMQKCALYIGIPFFALVMFISWHNYPIESQSFKLNTSAWAHYNFRLGNPYVKVYKYSDDEEPMYDAQHNHRYFQSTITNIGYNPAVRARAADFRQMIYYNLVTSLLLSLIVGLIVNYIMYRKGIKDTDSDVIDGVLFDPDPNNINKLLRDMGLESDLSIGGLSLVKDRETYHLKIVGNTGTGKTVLISKLIQQIRDLKNKLRLMDRIVILDVDSVFCDKYYDEKTDVILNPFDSRSSYYNVFKDIKTVYDADNIAEILVPEVKNGDPFWHTAPRTLISTLFTTIISNDSQEKTYSNLLDKALNIKLSKLEKFIENTPAANLIDGDVKKTALSLRSILLTHMRCFEPMVEIEKRADAKEFSFNQWIEEITSNVQNPTKQIFLTYDNNQLATLRPLITFWISLMNSKITSLPRSRTRRVWLFIDELANLGELSDFNGTLRMARNYGLCCVVGYQNESDIEDIYGRIKTSSLLGLFSTSFYFRPGEDDNTAERVSRNLGSQEISKVQSSRQFGVTDFRDGGSISEIEKTRRIVSPDALRSLPDRQAFVILPTEVPRTRVRLYYPGEKLDIINTRYSKWYFYGTGWIFKFFAELFLKPEDKVVKESNKTLSKHYQIESNISDYQSKIDDITKNSADGIQVCNVFEDEKHDESKKEVSNEENSSEDQQKNKADISESKKKSDLKTKKTNNGKEQNITKREDKETLLEDVKEKTKDQENVDNTTLQDHSFYDDRFEL